MKRRTEAVALDHAGGARDRLDAEGLLERAGGVGELLLSWLAEASIMTKKAINSAIRSAKVMTQAPPCPPPPPCPFLLRYGRIPASDACTLPGRRRDV